MIAKLTKGTGFRGALDYLFYGDRTQPSARGNVIASNMAGATPRELAKEFGALRKLRPTLKKAVCHTSISLALDDPKLTDKEFSFIAKRYLHGMGFKDCPYVVIRHTDKRHQHLHVLVSRVNVRGEVISDAQDFRRAEQVMRDLEKLYSLHKLPTTQPPQQQKERPAANQLTKGESTMRPEIKMIVENALQSAVNLRDFVRIIKERGMNISFHTSGSRVCGITFIHRLTRIKGSTLGSQYTWSAIAQRLNYDEVTDYAYIEELVKEEQALESVLTLSPTIEPRKRRDLARITQEPLYLHRLREHFGDKLLNASHTGLKVFMQFTDGTEMIDSGTQITARGHAPIEEIADKLIAVAKLKGWQAVVLTGSPAFLRHAMKAALRAGISVTPKDEMQEALLNEVKAELMGELQMTPAIAPAPAIAPVDALQTGRRSHALPPVMPPSKDELARRIGAIRDRFEKPKSPDEPNQDLRPRAGR